MHRQPLLDLLTQYEQQYSEESAVVAQIRALVENAEDCFDRTCRPGHITGSAWVMSTDRSRCLLVHHGKLVKWLQPGGHADGDTDVARVAMKEAAEETGLRSLMLADLLPLDVDVHVIPERCDVQGQLIEDAHEHHDIRFLVLASEKEAPTVSHESRDVRWFTEAEFREITQEESVLRLWRKAAAWG
ncbi:NUDIX hydrolase [Adhaeretor mobilis]|uniref:NUDIX domain protein n=1 Tax=Adhaeretor mobilis TaxID=1930276 RepID=A0A517N2A7_9BACT|nr:NUDIX hydrolase [Adhaeretor mobilis]QDT01290.1 NUDIX domain protein [Adhaeretor mobilis]